jgi:hypothetical protein
MRGISGQPSHTRALHAPTVLCPILGSSQQRESLAPATPLTSSTDRQTFNLLQTRTLSDVFPSAPLSRTAHRVTTSCRPALRGATHVTRTKTAQRLMLLPTLTTPLLKKCMFGFQTVHSMQHSEVRRSQNTQLQRCSTDKSSRGAAWPPRPSSARRHTVDKCMGASHNPPQRNLATNRALGRRSITLQRPAGCGSRTVALATTSPQNPHATHASHWCVITRFRCQAAFKAESERKHSITTQQHHAYHTTGFTQGCTQLQLLHAKHSKQ